MNLKQKTQKRRAAKTRIKIRELCMPRLCVKKTPRHMYAQLIVTETSGVDKTVVSASTLDKSLRTTLSATGNKEAARLVGELVAKRALDAGFKKIAFDRSGLKYHGRVKTLADAAREAGLQF